MPPELWFDGGLASVGVSDVLMGPGVLAPPTEPTLGGVEAAVSFVTLLLLAGPPVEAELALLTVAMPVLALGFSFFMLIHSGFECLFS